MMRILLFFMLALVISATADAESVNIRYIHSDKLTASGAAYVGLDVQSNGYFIDTTPKTGRSYAAVGFLWEDTNTTGWAYLQVTNNISWAIPGAEMPKVNDSVRAYTAGIAEGFLTGHMIEMHYLNTLAGYCDDDPAYCRRLDKFIKDNVQWMSKMVKAKRHVASFWHHTGLYLEQLSGIADGASKTFAGPRMNLNGYERLYLMNLNGDLGDLESALNMTEKFRKKHGTGGGCSAMVKITADGDLIASHDTWASYQGMLRLVKHYDLKLGHKHHVASGGVFVDENDDPTHIHLNAASVKISSYPAYITSLDDFHVTSHHLAVFETTIGNYNTTLWRFVQTSSVPTAIRGIVASRLARHGEDWHRIFSQFNSGTYNNEWIIVDYKAWERQKGSNKTKTGILVVSDQMPGSITTKDYTASLIRNSYFASYNAPSMPEVMELSNTTAMVNIYGPIYNYTNCPRGLIFARNHSRVHDISSALALMRYNNFKNDPLSLCKGCIPPYSAELAIHARCDLNDANGVYPIEFLSRRSHGGTDTKMTNADLIKGLNFIAHCGPTTDQQPPFTWSKTGWTMKDKPHYGQPDIFNFGPVIYD